MTNDDDRPTPDDGEGPVSTAASDGSDGSADADSSDTDGSDGARTRRRLPVWQESLLLVAAAIVLAIVVKALFVQAFYIPSASMEPGLVENDRILVQKVSYWFGGAPERGDVIVFADPGGWLGNTADDDAGPVQDLLSTVGLYPEGGHLVKRVIGVEGDVITCCDDQGRILVNGEPLDEDDYIAPRGEGVACNGPMVPCDWTAGPVPAGKVFVMGDNRADSADSTVHLCLPEEVDCTRDPFVDVDLVVGKVFAVAWPLGHLDLVGRPDALSDVPDPQD
ncbi:signal peptidase I [Nocardioides sp.]|uniref:signal peptidase I n=1 Tax=Nocardioides sp. TaxID=35761 RepID=UPI0027213196|nr:signal peptidase I [Nocardioides sp.]MDO9458011.1 signal peptidase I [Nocardioides sp.]